MEVQMEIAGLQEQHAECAGCENTKHRAKARHRHKNRKLWRDVKWTVIAFAVLCAVNVLVFELHW